MTETVRDDQWLYVRENPLPGMVERAPRVVYFWMRDYVFRVLVMHRTNWTRTTGVRFGRKQGSIKVPRVNDADPAEKQGDNVVRYTVRPEPRRFETDQAAAAGLAELEGRVRSTSPALYAHQVGAVMRPRKAGVKFLAIPLVAPGNKTRGRLTPSEFRKRNPKAVLLTRKSRRGRSLLVFERIRKRGGERKRLRRTKKGKIARSQPRTKVDVLVPRWVLLQEVQLPAALGFYETWRNQSAERGKLLRKAGERIARDIARGVDS